MNCFVTVSFPVSSSLSDPKSRVDTSWRSWVGWCTLEVQGGSTWVVEESWTASGGFFQHGFGFVPWLGGWQPLFVLWASSCWSLLPVMSLPLYCPLKEFLWMMEELEIMGFWVVKWMLDYNIHSIWWICCGCNSNFSVRCDYCKMLIIRGVKFSRNCPTKQFACLWFSRQMSNALIHSTRIIGVLQYSLCVLISRGVSGRCRCRCRCRTGCSVWSSPSVDTILVVDIEDVLAEWEFGSLCACLIQPDPIRFYISAGP